VDKVWVEVNQRAARQQLQCLRVCRTSVWASSGTVSQSGGHSKVPRARPAQCGRGVWLSGLSIAPSHGPTRCRHRSTGLSRSVV